MKRATITIHGAIPWTAVAEWARLHGLGVEESSLLAAVIHILDTARTERIASELRTK